jgi:starch phosphorylase
MSELQEDPICGMPLYDKLETIVPLYYRDRTAWVAVMRQTIAFNASYFNTHRMVQQYITHAYF